MFLSFFKCLHFNFTSKAGEVPGIIVSIVVSHALGIVGGDLIGV
jgi:uncharacterized membrane protein YjgN (DUF898 family)